MAIVKHLDQAEKLTVSLKASVNFLSLCGSVGKFHRAKALQCSRKEA